MDKVSAAHETDPGPSSGELIGAEFQKRRRRMFVGAAIVILAIGGAVAGFVVWGQRKATVRANDSFSSLSMCLFGETGPTDHPAVAFRQAQLGSMGIPEKSRGQEGGVAWPQRCAGDAQDLLDRAKDANLTSSGSKDVAYWADQLAKRLKAPDAHLADASEAIDNTIAEAKKAGLQIHASPSTKGPPGTAVAKGADEIAAAGGLITKQPFPLKELNLETSPGETQFALVQDATVSPSVFLCDFQATGVVCSKLPENITKAGHGLTLGGSTEKGASPLIFEGNRGDGGVFRSDTGDEIGKVYALGGASLASGGAYVLGWDDAKQEPFITSREKGAQKSRHENIKTKLSAVNAFFKPQMLWGQVIVPLAPKRETSDSGDADSGGDADNAEKKDSADKKKDEPGIFALPIDEKKGSVGEPVRILPLRVDNGEGTESHIVGCKTDKATIVVAWGLGGGDSLTFNIDGQWTKPLQSGLRGSLTCDGATLATASVAIGQTPWEGEIYETHCTSAKCENNTVLLKEIIPGGLELAPREAHGGGNNLVDVVEIADKLVVAWMAGERGGVRVKVGASHDIADAKDAVVVDDLFLDGKTADESTVTDLRLIHAPGHAVLLVSTKAGVLALRVDPTGEVTPEKVTWK